MSHSIDEYYSQYDETDRVASADVKCDACDEIIRVGQKYVLVEIWRSEDEHECPEDAGDDPHESDNGLWLTKEPSEELNRCARCQKIHLHLRDKSEGDELWPDEQLNCGEEYGEHWGEDPPPDIAALAFALPGETKL